MTSYLVFIQKYLYDCLAYRKVIQENYTRYQGVLGIDFNFI